MARTPDLQLHALWREYRRRQVDRRLTIAQFCAQEGLSTATFHSWKRRRRLISLAVPWLLLAGGLWLVPLTG